MPRKKEYKVVVPELESKVGKYFLGLKAGKTKSRAVLEAGYSYTNSIDRVEASKGFQALKAYYKDELTKRMTIGQIADEHMKVMMQDNELGPKMAAIKIALDKIEPEEHKSDDDERVMVILK
jgi:hypothetical protein